MGIRLKAESWQEGTRPTGRERRRIRLLLVESNPDDVRLVREALAGGPTVELTAVNDGVEALRYLRREGEYAQAPPPNLILLELNLPNKDGRDVLAEIKSDPTLRGIPVVVLTSSGSDVDIRICYELNANSFVRKHGDYGAFMDTLRAIEHYWLGTASLPTPISWDKEGAAL